jgi:hypothetical protein
MSIFRKMGLRAELGGQLETELNFMRFDPTEVP